MEIREETIEQVCVLNLIGRLEASNSTDLKEKVTDLVNNKQVLILADMSHVDFIDSSGLGALVNCLRAASKSGGVFKITSLQDYTRNLFSTTRLDRVFELFNERDDAIKSFS